jgi:hypothetical protein
MPGVWGLWSRFQANSSSNRIRQIHVAIQSEAGDRKGREGGRNVGIGIGHVDRESHANYEERRREWRGGGGPVRGTGARGGGVTRRGLCSLLGWYWLGRRHIVLRVGRLQVPARQLCLKIATTFTRRPDGSVGGRARNRVCILRVGSGASGEKGDLLIAHHPVDPAWGRRSQS